MSLRAGRLLPRDKLPDARAGDCVRGKRWIYCLPAVINIGAQKAGTGELQTWLEKHPAMLVHGGEVHFFDTVENGAACDSESERVILKLKYLRFLWRRRRLTAEAVTSGPLMLPASPDTLDAGELPMVNKVAFEKTPAYMDVADPALLACIAPETKLLVMLREPVARTISAYQMCQSMKMGRWCRDPMEEAVAFAMHNHTDPPTLNQQALQLRPALRRTFTLGFYSAHISRWLVHFPGSSMRVQWVEHFKADPFRGMWAAENFLGLPHHDYRQQATKNDAGLWVVGKSKSNNRKAHTPARPATTQTLRRFYAPWQHDLRTLLASHNLSLLPDLPIPQ